jgi:hypothetical protein
MQSWSQAFTEGLFQSRKIPHLCFQVLFAYFMVVHDSFQKQNVVKSVLKQKPVLLLLWLYSPWTGDQPVARPLSTHRATQTQNKRTQTSMPPMGFEPTIPVFERAKTVHALDHAATVIGIETCISCKYILSPIKSSKNQTKFTTKRKWIKI